MDPRMLIDGIVRQTTVLIAQLSTAAGVRAPLAHVADEVFLTLAREIEAQGVGRKVAADMFGVALRTYQRRVQRAESSVAERETSLWESVLEYVTARERAVRGEIIETFSRDEERDVIGVLTDLVASGLVYASGRGSAAIYRAMSEADRQALSESGTVESAASVLWASIYRHPGITPAELAASWKTSTERIGALVDHLVRRGRVDTPGNDASSPLRAARLVVPVGASQGWEAAVYDHFQAVASAIAAKLALGRTRSAADDRIGGATITFDITRDHPDAEDVYALLARVRADVNSTWDRVCARNREFPIDDADRIRVTFYFGQNVSSAGDDPSEDQE